MTPPHAFSFRAVTLACAASAGLLACAGSSDPSTSGSNEALAATSTPPSPAALAVNPARPSNASAANHFQLSGAGLRITYDDAAGPVLVYQDGQQSRTFRDGQIVTIETPVGRLATVVLIPTVDTGSTTFSLLLPPVRVASDGVAPVVTEGITTVHRFSVVPSAMLGQLDEYNFTALEGSARVATATEPTSTTVITLPEGVR